MPTILATYLSVSPDACLAVGSSEDSHWCCMMTELKSVVFIHVKLYCTSGMIAASS